MSPGARRRRLWPLCLLCPLGALVLPRSPPAAFFGRFPPPHFDFQPVETQFIAALGDPAAKSGAGAQSWGIWRVDPGPRGVYLRDWPKLQADGGAAPSGWAFDQEDWWLEEYGRIMEKPDFPVPAGRYLVTGGRETTAVLKVLADGSWELEDGANLYDVTHLPCRSARYTPAEGSGGSGLPGGARLEDFPVRPGAPMPPVEGCEKQDYAVLFVIGLEA
mmetsp:Transcript_81906/g.240430  ORF Transcript_81906/g.240430 Transcript_81906/m.240430 type:complete len:218 (-) Transcript_81906:35-688(-)